MTTPTRGPSKRTIALVAISAVVAGLLVAGGILALIGRDSDGANDTKARGGVPFDRAFIDAMVPHHESAIEMAKTARKRRLSNAELSEIADSIVINQQDEIDRMKRWRARWYGSAKINSSDASALGLSRAEMGMQHDASMLATASDVDAEFASMMIDHHKGAVRMANLALTRGNHVQIRNLARRIITDQQREIRVMKKYTRAKPSG